MNAEPRPPQHAANAAAARANGPHALSSTYSTSSSSSNRREQKTRLPVNVAIPSFSSFRAQAAPTSTASPVRRKPVPAFSPPGPARLDTSIAAVAAAPPRAPEPWPSIGAEPVRQSLRPSSTGSSPLIVRDLDRFPHGQSPAVTQGPGSEAVAAAAPRSYLSRPGGTTVASPRSHERLHSDSSVTSAAHRSNAHPADIKTAIVNSHKRASTMSLYQSFHPGKPNLQVDSSPRKASHDSNDSDSTSKPRSPGAKLTSFFGWKSSSPGPASSATSVSDKTGSPGTSPRSPKSFPYLSQPLRTLPAAIDVPRANAALQTHTGQALPAAFEEMEAELREISAELATSIRREMDLEDLVDRMQAEATNPPVQNRRTSDYFSDSGTSSVRFPHGESDSKELDLEKLQRRTEQEKAQLRVDLTQRVQEERSRRIALEKHVSEMEERVQRVDHDQLTSLDESGRARELEASLEDLRRRLAEERQVKENFEDLLTALRGEIHEHRNERDNLRDEIVPQLRARVEGLESEAAEFQKLTYENARMQQELQSLKNENTTLMNARKLQLEMQSQQSRINSIAEDGAVSSASGGLARSFSLARGTAPTGKAAGLSRSNSGKDRESRESLAERVKDIEAQRDALHGALKSLLHRQDFQNREAEKKMKALESERDRALAGTLRKGYDREVYNLREEINHLRRRADDALEQKWQCEKGLSGLKMDLDRAEQETSSLRGLLSEHDISIPELPGRTGSGSLVGGATSSASLEKSYRELRTTHALSLARIRDLEGHGAGSNGSQLGSAGAETQRTMDLLRKSISDAEAERDFAQNQAEQYRLQAESLRRSESKYMSEEQSMAGQLRASAQRVEELAIQVRQQLASNNTLRQRLAEAIGRGEREQKTSAARISEMQSKLKALEDKVMLAQQHSEETVSKHEDEVKDLRESHRAHLQRMKNGMMSPQRFSLKASPISPLFTVRSPRLDVTTSGQGVSITEETKTAFLASKVDELETALTVADKEMEEVVSRMNMAQIEVMELQSERDEAMRQTRRLQTEIDQERQKVKAVIT
ncbi:MAG: hypothetical protein M1838_002670 [Thelocarpon superellum]|nr:MAG: hypothetical protein M1838_002670 [Thelocarpon superellum]